MDSELLNISEQEGDLSGGNYTILSDEDLLLGENYQQGMHLYSILYCAREPHDTLTYIQFILVGLVPQSERSGVTEESMWLKGIGEMDGNTDKCRKWYMDDRRIDEVSFIYY